MGSVGTPIARRMIEVAHGPERRADLFASVGLTEQPESEWVGQAIDEDAYYDLVERIAGDDDPEFPLRYGRALQPTDLGALGLVMKTSPTVEDALGRMVRYILVLTDTLQYSLTDTGEGRAFSLTERPASRRGAMLANECALAAVVSILDDSAAGRVRPSLVTFRHPGPSSTSAHEAHFGCRVRFGSSADAVHFPLEELRRPMALADAGLSAYLAAQLDSIRARTAERSLVETVRGAVADALPDGQPSKSRIARRLGMSERTLHRRLAEQGATFQDVATDARRSAAVSLLTQTDHSLVEVAFLTGFSDQTAFSRAFRRWTGTSPAAFRSDGASGDA